MNFCGRISVFSENIQISKQASQWMVGQEVFNKAITISLPNPVTMVDI